MCESHDGKFVVPVMPSAGMGWWIGRVISASDHFLFINTLWAENPRFACTNFYSTHEYVKEFSDMSDAIEHLKSKGTKDFALSPIEIGY